MQERILQRFLKLHKTINTPTPHPHIMKLQRRMFGLVYFEDMRIKIKKLN
jgi:hypothetical protein